MPTTLTAKRQERGLVKEELDKKQKEKEQLLEKAAKGRQILLNSQFTDQASVEKYRNETRQHFEDHASAKAACNKRSRSVGAFLLMFLAMLGIGSSLFFLLAPETGISLLSSLAPRLFTALTCHVTASGTFMRALRDSFPDCRDHVNKPQPPF